MTSSFDSYTGDMMVATGDDLEPSETFLAEATDGSLGS